VDELKERIRKDGTVINSEILKVDRFLNHQIDPQLMKKIGKAFAKHFQNAGITKVLTIESSGIAPALMTGLEMNVPVLFARKKKSLTINEDSLTTDVYSFTKKVHNTIFLENDTIIKEDHVLIIDDFLANGEAALGLTRLVDLAGAAVSGIGIVIEKSFQQGRGRLDRAGYAVYSLARIASLNDHHVQFLD
jgi:xanthine phosphoribosyltransferase